jgi:hypothetical protein
VRKRRILLLCLIGAALAVIALIAYKPTSHEPSYDGHPLSFWVLTQVTATYDPDQPAKATNAINHIGPAALPFLVKWIQYEPPGWRSTFGILLEETPFITVREFGDQIRQPTAYRLAAATPYAFGILGKTAMPAFDDLCRLMNETNRPCTASQAALALSHLGTNAVPPLLAVVTNEHHPARLAAINAIGKISYPSDAAQLPVPTITSCLSDTNNPDSQVIATIALGDLKSAPQISIPALVSSLNNGSTELRRYSAIAIGCFGSQASNAIPALTNALKNSDTLVRYYATEALHQIAPTAFPDAPSR